MLKKLKPDYTMIIHKVGGVVEHRKHYTEKTIKADIIKTCKELDIPTG